MTPSTILLYICFCIFVSLSLFVIGYFMKVLSRSKKLKISSNNISQKKRKKISAIPLKTEEPAYTLSKTGNS